MTPKLQLERPNPLLALSVLCLALILCPPIVRPLVAQPIAPQESAPPELLSPDVAREEIRKLATAAVAEKAVGLSVALAYGDQIVLDEGFGLAEVEHHVPANAETMFRIGSITKQFTSALVMQLVEQGKIGLDDPISKYCEFETGDYVVTIRHLLTHTSGIKSYTGLGEAWLKTVALELSHEELLAMVEDLPFDFEPGDEFRYNNTGYYLLGVILENVTGKSYDQLILDLAHSQGLERTRYGSNKDIIENRAQGYTVVDGVLQNDALIGMSQPGGAGALLSTAGDLVRWQRALSSGKVVSAESYHQMIQPYELTGGEKSDYGFGLGIGEMDGLATIQHGGGIPGFNSMLTHFPETGVTLSVISNNEGYGSSALAKEIARLVHGIEVTILDLAVPAEEQARLAGVYALEQIPVEMKIRAEGEHLFLTVTGQGEDRLLRQDEGSYRAAFDNDVAIEFAEGNPAPGLVLRQGGGTFDAKRKLD